MFFFLGYLVSSNFFPWVAMNTSYGANLEISQCIAASPICRPKSSIFEPRSCVPKLQGFSKKVLPLCKDLHAKSNRERSITFSVTASASQVDTASDEPSSLTYKDAGVDIDAGSELVRRIAKLAPGIGGFGGLFPLGNVCHWPSLCWLILLHGIFN